MAITVKSTPATYGTYMSAHNDLMFVVDSSNKAEPNFKYVFDVYVDAALVGRFKVVPEVTYTYGVFNASTIVRNYLDSLYFKGEQVFRTVKTADGFFQKGFVIKYGEEYGTTVTTYTNLTTSPTYTVYNYYNEFSPIKTDELLGSYVAKFLTTNTAQRTVTLKDNFYIYYWNPAAASKTFTLTKYNSSGVSLGTQSVPTITDVLQQFNIGPAAINNTYAGFITEAVSYYTLDDGSNTISLALDCFPKYEHYSLVFLNKLGGFESAYFRLKHKRTVTSERKTFGKKNYTMHSSAGEISYHDSVGNVRLGMGGVMAVKQTNKFQLNSDFLTDNEFESMMQLMTSPVVYLERATYASGGGGTYYTVSAVEYFPVKILADTFDLKTRQNDKLQSFSVEIEQLEHYNSQFL